MGEACYSLPCQAFLCIPSLHLSVHSMLPSKIMLKGEERRFDGIIARGGREIRCSKTPPRGSGDSRRWGQERKVALTPWLDQVCQTANGQSRVSRWREEWRREGRVKDKGDCEYAGVCLVESCSARGTQPGSSPTFHYWQSTRSPTEHGGKDSTLRKKENERAARECGFICSVLHHFVWVAWSWFHASILKLGRQCSIAESYQHK